LQTHQWENPFFIPDRNYKVNASKALKRKLGKQNVTGLNPVCILFHILIFVGMLQSPLEGGSIPSCITTMIKRVYTALMADRKSTIKNSEREAYSIKKYTR
jgi:hypothetical protein